MLVDAATGSNELAAPLAKLGLPVEVCHLDFGDIAFMGRGEHGAPLYVGIEYKKVGELVGSLTTKRFQGHQLPGLAVGFDRRYLLVEGVWTHNERGQVVVPSKFKSHEWMVMKGAPLAVTFELETFNITTRGGCEVHPVNTRKDTLRWLLTCYRYWTDKDLDEHKSHLAIYTPDMDKGLLTPPSDFRAAVKVLLPGIGYKASGIVEQWCNSSWRVLMSKRQDDWAELAIPDAKGNTKRLGEKRAKAIMEKLK